MSSTIIMGGAVILALFIGACVGCAELYARTNGHRIRRFGEGLEIDLDLPASPRRDTGDTCK